MEGLELRIRSDKAIEAANKFRAAIDHAAAAVDRATKGVDRLDTFLDDVGAAARNAERPMARVGREVDQAARKKRAASRDARELSKSLTGLADRTSIVSSGFVRLSAALGGFFALRKALGAIAATEDKLRILQSVTGATSEELERLKSTAEGLSIDTRFSFGAATQGLIELAKAGASASEATASIRDVSNLARAGLIDVADAAERTVATIAQFGLSFEDSARIADVLVRAADATTSSVSSLGDSLSKVGPIGRELGLSLESVTAAVAQLQQAGVPAEIAGTGLGRLLKALSDPANGPEAAAQAIRDLGLSFAELNPADFGRVLDRLAKANITLKDATALVGTQFDRLLITLVRNREEFGKLEQSLKAAGGDAAAKASATVGTLGESLDKFGNAVDRLFRTGGERGLSTFFRSIVDTGRDAINVLSGNEAAMADAGEAGVLLANATKGAAVGLAGIATAGTLRSLTSLAAGIKGAGLSVRALSAAAAANPLGAFLTIATTAASAFALFGDRVRDTSRALDDFLDQAREAETVAARFDDIRRNLQIAAAEGEVQRTEALTRALRAQLIEVEKLRALGNDRVPAEAVLGAIEQAAPETIAKLRAVIRQMAELEKKGADVPATLQREFAELNSKLGSQFGFKIATFVRGGTESLDEFIARLAKGEQVLGGFDVAAEQASRAISQELNRMTGDADSAREALERAKTAVDNLRAGSSSQESNTSRSTGRGEDRAASSERRRVDAVRDLIEARTRELALLQQGGEAQRQQKLLQEAISASVQRGSKLRAEELLQLGLISQAQEALLRAEQQRDFDSFIQALRHENELLQAQGVERDILAKKQEVAIQLAAFEGSITDEQRASVEKLVDTYEKLLLVKEANNELTKQAAEANLQYSESTEEATKQSSRFGEQIGNSIGNALERLIFDGAKARDVLKSLLEDLSRQAFRQAVTNQLSNLFGQALGGVSSGGGAATGGALSGIFAGAAGGYAGANQNLSGGLIPAMTGQLVASPTVLTRGGNRYSVAEGGGVTPEAIFPLQRDSQGRLGVVAAGGGGGDNITMVFPSVRNAQDARAVRATRGQIARRVQDADKRGRRGLRPKGA